jgi:hypothetical protein
MAQLVVNALSIVDMINLEPYKWKLSRAYPDLSTEDLELLDLEYRRFLKLKISYPHKRFSPTRNMDKVWHQHILDTASYRRDCMNLFGKFIDHRPYFGPHSAEGVWEQMSDRFDSMNAIYQQHFGENPAEDLDIFVEKNTKRSFCSNNPYRPGETCDPGDGCDEG